MNGHTTTVVTLLERGTDINSRDKVSTDCMYICMYVCMQAESSEHRVSNDVIWPYCTSPLSSIHDYSYWREEQILIMWFGLVDH